MYNDWCEVWRITNALLMMWSVMNKECCMADVKCDEERILYDWCEVWLRTNAVWLMWRCRIKMFYDWCEMLRIKNVVRLMWSAMNYECCMYDVVNVTNKEFSLNDVKCDD